jgi:hypothetical protein
MTMTMTLCPRTAVECQSFRPTGCIDGVTIAQVLSHRHGCCTVACLKADPVFFSSDRV